MTSLLPTIKYCTFFPTEATEVFAKLLVKVTKTNQTAGTLNLSDHSFICAFWILSALATKGEL